MLTGFKNCVRICCFLTLKDRSSYMGYAVRKKIIEEIQSKRNSKVITLITSDRYSSMPLRGLQGQIAPDQIYKVIQHCKLLNSDIDEIKQIDLFIYSRGGDVNTAWPLVNTIRNYCNTFKVLIPIAAHSAATLIALGADEIVMTKIAQLSPIDPTVANAFNPKDEKSKQPLGISVEDVTSFISLAKDKDKVDISDEKNITKVFEILANKVHPLALGNVKRSHAQIRLLARKLLGFHIKSDNTTISIEKVIDELTERLYSHSHLIFRNEARDSIGLGEVIKDADEEEEKLFWELYKDYEDEMMLKDFFEPNAFLGTANEKKLNTTTVLIDSDKLSSKFSFEQNIIRAAISDPNFRLQLKAQEAQYKTNTSQFMSQLLQLRMNFSQIRSKIAQLLSQQTNNQDFIVLNNSCNDIDNEINKIISSLPKELDLTELKKQIEFDIISLGWVDITK